MSNWEEMKKEFSKYCFKNWQRRLFRLSGLLIMLGISLSLSAQTNCGCKSEINVTLDGTCNFLLTIDNVGAGDCSDAVRIIVNDPNPSNGPLIDCAGLYEYVVLDENDEGLCWGKVRAEDKTGPRVANRFQKYTELECHLVDKLVNNPKTIEIGEDYYLGQVTFEDNCTDCGCGVTRTFSDKLIYNDCDVIEQTGVYITMIRTWKGVDCMGNETVEDQIFEFVRPSLDDLTLRADTTFQSCDISEVQVIDRYPYWTDVFGDRIYLNEIDCNYATTLRRDVFDACRQEAYKETVFVEVLDWCTGETILVDTYINKVGDFAGPVFSGNAKNIKSNNVFNDLLRNVDLDSLFRVDTIFRNMPVVTTGPVDCSAAISLSPQNLQDLLGFGIEDCADYSFNARFYSYLPPTIYDIPVGQPAWMETTYPILNAIATGIPVGIHAMVMELEDNCYSHSTGILFFKVKDLTPPIAKCTDQIHLSVTSANTNALNQEAYGRIYPDDIDEGSTDNCELGTFRLRRSVADLLACEQIFIDAGYDANNDGRIDEQDWWDENNNGEYDEELEFKWEFTNGEWFTPWRDFAEVFCCDVGNQVTIEMGVWDQAIDPLSGMSMPNLNTCWQTTVVEDNTVPRITSLPTIYRKCTDPLITRLEEGEITGRLLEEVRDSFGVPATFGVFCGDYEIKEFIEDERDICGFGELYRVIEIHKNRPNKSPVVSRLEQEILVTEVFSYSITFPADLDTTCISNADTLATTLEYQSNGCDLLAVSYTDDRFDSSPDGDACYKIFRTYKVVNWCEYDGISPPVIVGRDWDTWQGCDAGAVGSENYEYNINPLIPDGDDRPGDEDITVIVRRDFLDNAPDTVYYDRNNDPFDNVPDDPNTRTFAEGYWWKVVSGSNDPEDPDYYDGGYRCSRVGVWDNDQNQPTGGTNAQDDDDYRYGSNGYWQYTQHIKIYDSDAPFVELSGPDMTGIDSQIDCGVDYELMINTLDDCTNNENLIISVRLDENNDGVGLVNINGSVNDGKLNTRLPIGTHRFVVRVSDLCGNSTSAEKIVTVKDDIAPNPICLSGLVVELMPSVDGGGAMTVWASDFVASPIGDCTGQGPELAPVGNGFTQPMVTDYSINMVGMPAQRGQDGITVTCNDLADLVPVELHAWDEAGNHGYCNTFIEVQDNQSICDESLIGSGVLAGQIAKEDLETVEGVRVELSGLRSVSFATGADGAFAFRNLAEGYDYTITPRNDEDHLNGVSTFDLVMISRHILGSSKLDNPYKLIAADINRSKTITTLDLIELRKIILRIDQEFKSNTSWRFVEASHVFPRPNDPWFTPFPEFRNVNNLDGVVETDFVAVKIGDVNNSARANSAQYAGSRSTAGTLEILTENLDLQAGEEYLIPFRADLSEVTGYQFTLSYDPASIELLELEEGMARAEHFGVFTQAGVLTTSFHRADAAVAGEQTLFGLRIRARTNGSLSRLIQLNSAYTEAEAYNTHDELLGVALSLDGQMNVADGNQLLQNQPNPFRSETTIGFYLKEAGPVELNIRDINGRAVQTITGNYGAGYHRIELNREDLPNSGVFFYQLRADEYLESKQMILVE